jgi:hypothetical protein
LGRTSWVCVTCEQHFTRRFSADRHNKALHAGKGFIARVGNNLVKSASVSPEGAHSPNRYNLLNSHRYNSSNPFAGQATDNIIKTNALPSCEQTNEPDRRFTFPPNFSETIVRKPISPIMVVNKFIKLQELNELLSDLGPS